MAFIRKILTDRRWRQDCFEFGNGIKHGLHERIRIWARPGAIVAIGAEFVVIDNVSDFRNEAACVFTVNFHDGFRRCAKPPGIRGETVVADWFAPGSVVVTAVSRSTPFLDHYPGVNSKDAAPPNGTRRENANERLGMGCRRSKQPGAGTIGRLPISPTVSEPKITGGRRADRHENQ